MLSALTHVTYADEVPRPLDEVVIEGLVAAEGLGINPHDPLQGRALALVQQYLKGADREHFVVLMLNAQHEVVGIHTATIGTIDGSLIHPRELFKAAILANAVAVIVAHNHPSGNVTPSPEDRTVTNQLCDAGKVLGIPIIDHVIVGTAPPFAYYSFAEAGLISGGGL